MFGKGQGAMGIWIKEFCQLVFIQTLQAFIYAIIISFVVTLMTTTSFASGMDGNDYRTGLGLVCVFAMVSVFKIEELVRKIFGFGPTKADHHGAVKSIAKTAFAMQLGKRVLDNGKKVAGGAGKMIKSNKDAAKARKRLKEDETDLKGDMTGKLQSEFEDDFGKQYRTSAGTAGVGGGNASARGGTKNYNQKIRALKRANEDKLSEIKKQRREALKEMSSGILETGGAIYGATTGAIIGGADGNIDEALQGLVAGAGIGDAIGQTTVNITASAGGFVGRRGKNVAGAYKLGKEMKGNYSSSRENGDGFRKAASDAVKEAINSRAFQMAQYKQDIKRLDSTVDNIE